MALPDQAVTPPLDRDSAILERITKGDPDAYRLIMQRYRDHVAAIVAGHLPSQDVEELVHEVFVSAYRSLPAYQDTVGLDRWLSRIAVRRCHDYWRAAYRRRESPHTDLSETAAVWLTSHDGEQAALAGNRDLARQETRELVHWGLGRLSPADRTVLTLVHLQEHSVREAAELLGLSIANVKIRAFRARRKLQTILEREAHK